jgi:hypothetical protein
MVAFFEYDDKPKSFKKAGNFWTSSVTVQGSLATEARSIGCSSNDDEIFSSQKVFLKLLKLD